MNRTIILVAILLVINAIFVINQKPKIIVVTEPRQSAGMPVLSIQTGKRLQGGYNILPVVTSAYWLQGSRNRPLPVITTQSEHSDYIWQPTAQL